ncbi:6-bladed beta-propeller [Candidatus Palauibacter sp.]|uniref:6-bladed beta-propeller n=1 Tax=Candidatus Palauibacter sp. TaxID=3101350 RepID=UPI003D10F057
MPIATSSFKRYLALLSLAVTGCSSDGTTSTVHPLQKELRNLEAGATAIIRPDTAPPAEMNEEAASRWRLTRRAILDARPGPVLGSFDEDGPAVFATHVAVTLGSGGRTHVLDAMSGRVVEFDSAGRFMSEFGRVGDGPMEFRTPRDIDAWGDSLLVTQDGRVKVFHRSASEYVPRDHLPVQIPLYSICPLDGNVFASVQRQPNAPLARYDLQTLTPARSFGRGYPSGPDLVRARLSLGPVACVEDPARVVHGYQYLPGLNAYTPQGDQAWSAFLSDYMEGKWTYTAAGWLETPIGAKETLTNLVTTSSGFVVASYFRADESARRTSRVYLVDASTGHGALIEETDAPDREIMAIAEDRYVTYVIGPYPRLRIWYMDDPE